MEEKCKEILINAAYEKIDLQRKDIFHYKLKEMFLSDNFRDYVKDENNGFSLTVPIEGVPFALNAKTKDTEFEKFRTHIEQLKEEELYKSTYINFSSTLLNDRALELWGDCMARQSDLEIHGEIRDSDHLKPGGNVELYFKWNPRNIDDKPPVITRDLSYSSLLIGTNKLLIKEGEKLTPAGMTQVLTIPKDFSGRLLLSFDTTRGPWHGVLNVKPTIIEPEELKPILKGVWDGDQRYVSSVEGNFQTEPIEYRINEEPVEGKLFFLYEKGIDTEGDYTVTRDATLKNGVITWTDIEGNRGEIKIVGLNGMTGKFFRPAGYPLKEYHLTKKS